MPDQPIPTQMTSDTDPTSAVSRRAVLQIAASAAIGAIVSEHLGNAVTRAAVPTTNEHSATASANVLWYRQPAQEWTEALPLGNGRMGAMVFGGVQQERLQLNEDTLWAGGPYNPVSPEAAAALPVARKLVFDGKYVETAKLFDDKLAARPLRQMPYQTVGELLLNFAGAAETPADQYRRELDLNTATASVRYVRDGVTYSRQAFATATDDVIVVRVAGDQPGRVSFSLSFDSPLPTQSTTEANNTLVVQGQNGESGGIAGALKFQARVRAVATGGTVKSGNGTLEIAEADSVVLLIAMATSYKRFDDVSGDPTELTRAAIDKAVGRSFDALLADHVADHQKLFNRVSIDLGTTEAAQVPTDERVKHSASTVDPALAALYYQFGRYLLIACSRPGTQPATLQGIWNDMISPPWGSKYTININTEMNYWPAEPANLPECVEPLVRMLEDLTITGATTAKAMYGARGWVCHHNTDLWRATAPIDGPNWGMWPTGGAWLCKHLWDHYEFAGETDRQYLQRIYPILQGAALFFVDTLVEEPSHGWLVTNPSISPENMHPHGSAICAGPTMDNQIIRDLFDNCIKAAAALDVDAELRDQLATMRDRLPPTQVGKDGQIMEWLADWDATAPDQRHRHISHLYGLYPSNQIDPASTPKLAEAAKVTLNARGDVTTGWAIAWRINCWARLRDAERTHKIIRLLLDPSRTYPNLFDAHPPFQIDGNFGGTSGMTEMILQSHAGELDLLPTLPKAWPSGHLTGIRGRGGFKVDVVWSKGSLDRVTIQSAADRTAKVRYGERVAKLNMTAGASVTLDGQLKPV